MNKKYQFAQVTSVSRVLPKIATLAVLCAPILVYAADSGSGCPTPPQDFKCLTESFTGVLGYAVYFLVASALLVFLWGVAKYILAAGAEDKLKEGKEMIIYGLIGLTVMLSVWGLVGILRNAVFKDISNTPPPVDFGGGN